MDCSKLTAFHSSLEGLWDTNKINRCVDNQSVLADPLADTFRPRRYHVLLFDPKLDSLIKHCLSLVNHDYPCFYAQNYLQCIESQPAQSIQQNRVASFDFASAYHCLVSCHDRVGGNGTYSGIDSRW